MSKAMEIRGHGGRVRIEVYKYERQETSNLDDSNWVVTQCTVNVGEFSCVLNLSLVTSDFVRFAAQLEEGVRSLQGSAEFTTLEEGIRLEVTFTSAGHAHLIGRARSQVALVPDQTTLSFSFETDQSFLAQTLQELKGVMEQFPTRRPSSR
ncbi:MAG TPA: hypothetical protein VEH50_08755 [Methylomirabilota bacterium]|nr:hypothetical protein [Methylomirabilota bacterium]